MEGGSSGWRIRFCDNITFADGPGSIAGGQYDLQGIQTHEYGHALGLGHSNVGGATMWPSIGSANTSTRSISSDDIAGLRAIYGVKDPSKPLICGTSVSGGTLTISGTRFDPVANEVWFTPTAVTSTWDDPRIRLLGVGSTSNGTEITVTIPAGVSPGDVLVKTSGVGNPSLSNAFPLSLTGSFSVPCPFSVSNMTPSTLEALDPGTSKSVSLTGVELDDTVQIDLNGNTVASSRWAIQSPTSITIDMPLGQLGANTLTLSNGADSHAINFTITEPSSPKLELGTGEPTYTVANGENMPMVVAGKVGTLHNIYYSNSNLPSSFPKGTFDMGNNFTHFVFAALFAIGPEGYTEFLAPISFTGPPTTFYSQSIDLTTAPSPNFGISNLQTITLTP